MIVFQLSPTVIILAFCYSLNSDLTMLLRSNGTFSSMILNHDLKVITGNPLAEMNHVQKDLLAEIGLIFSRRLENELSFNVSSCEQSGHLPVCVRECWDWKNLNTDGGS